MPFREGRIGIGRGRKNLPENFASAPNIFITEIERRQAKTQDVRIAEIADHAARDQRLTQRIGVRG